MFSLGDGSGLSSLQMKDFFCHQVMKFVLPLNQLVPATHDLFGGQTMVPGQRGKAQIIYGLLP